MADRVQADLELMLNELEQMQRVGLLSPDEVKQVVKRRKRFEYNWQKQTKVKEDILRYIQYECSLLDLIELRRDKIGYLHKKHQIDGAIARRINDLFRIARSRFGQTDSKLWITHIAFLQRMGWDAEIGKVLKLFLQSQSFSEEAVVLASRYQLETKNEVDNARAILLEGLRHNQDSETLFREYFMLELEFIRRLNAESDDDNEKVFEFENEELKEATKSGSIALAVFKQAMERVDDERFISELLALSNKFPVRSVFDRIKNEFLEARGDKESSWMILAKIELYPRFNEKRTAVDKITDCAKIYDQALDKFKSDAIFKSILGDLEEIRTRVDNTDEAQTQTVVKITVQMLEKAKKFKILPPEYNRILASVK